MSITEALSQVIDSEDKWETVCRDYGFTFGAMLPGYGTGDTAYPSAPWWVAREKARMGHSIYKSSDVLSWVNEKAPWAFMHVSNEDQDMIAYTADPEAAKRDKQLKTSLGKALVKLFPYYRDEFVQRMVAEHKAEVNMVVEYLTTPEEIVAAYKGGVGSCMSHEQSDTKWSKLKGRHPVEAYGNVKGLALAIIRGGDGRVKARTLVRPDTKKFIRSYGDDKLRKYLLREGFRAGDLGGLTLNTVDLGDNNYILPYLDQNNAAGNTTHCTVAMIGGKIRVLTSSEYTRWTRAGLKGHASGVTQSGFVTLTNVMSDEFSNEDFMTGETFTGATQRAVYRDGRKGNTELSTEVLTEMGYAPALWTKYDTVWAPQANLFVEESTGDSYVDHPSVRAERQYVKLSQTFYPGQEWTKIRRKTTSSGTVTTEEGHLIREEDAVVVLNPGADPVAMTGYTKGYWHKSEVMPEDYIKLHSPSKTEIVYAAPGMAWHRTSTGRKVVPGFHEAIELWNGEWELKGNTKLRTSHVYGFKKWYLGDTPPAEISESSPAMIEALLKRVDRECQQEEGLGAESIRHWFTTVRNNIAIDFVLDYNSPDGDTHGAAYISNWCWPEYRGMSEFFSEQEIGNMILREVPGIVPELRAASIDWYERNCRLDAERKRWNNANWVAVRHNIVKGQEARAVAEFEALPTTVVNITNNGTAFTVHNGLAGGFLSTNAISAATIQGSAIRATEYIAPNPPAAPVPIPIDPDTAHWGYAHAPIRQ